MRSSISIGVVLLLFASSCALLPKGDRPDRPVGEGEPHYKVGNAYKIQGVWYYPEENYQYDEVGIASWYGDDFHGKPTANGERFDMNALTAAHKTLPLPSMVQVTNLENGRNITLRVNDRGPFVGDRIIDLSRRSAQLLGFQAEGIAKVRVRILAEESMAIAAKLKGGKKFAARKATVGEVSESPLPEGAPIEAAAPQREAPLVGGNKLFVQVGAFLDSANADKLLQVLGDQGFAPAKKFSPVDDKLIRVRLGPFSTMGEAKNLLGRVVKKGFADSRLVVVAP